MLLSKSQLKHPPVDNPPPAKRGKKFLYGSASMMLALMVGSAPYAVAQDDDSDKDIRGTIQFTEGKYEVPEMSGKVVLCVERRGGKKGGVVAMYGTTSGSAKPGSDYMSMMGHLMWPDGDESTKPIVIPIKKDKAVEKDKETFYVTLLDMPSMDMDEMSEDEMSEDEMQKDGMMSEDMADWQYCMPKDEMPEGDMSKEDMMSDGEMMDDMGNPDTVYFGGRFQAKVEIVDNKEPPPPAVEPPPPPGQAGTGQDGQPDQGEPGTSPSGDDDDSPSVIEEDEPPTASKGDNTVVAINTQTFTNLFSVKLRIVVTSDGTMVTQRVVTKQTYGVSRKVGVARARIDIRGRTRSDDGGFSEEDVNAFFDYVESLYPTTIDRESAIEEGVLVGSLGDILLPDESGSWVSVSIDPETLNVAPAITTSLAQAIIGAYPDDQLIVNGDAVTYISANGVAMNVIADYGVAPCDAGVLEVTANGTMIMVGSGGLCQTFELIASED